MLQRQHHDDSNSSVLLIISRYCSNFRHINKILQNKSPPSNTSNKATLRCRFACLHIRFSLFWTLTEADNHHHISVMELGHLLARSGLTYPEVSSKVYHDSLCPLGSSFSLHCVIYFVAWYLHVVFSFSCIPVICPKLVLFLTPLQFVHLFCNLSSCILLFFSCISSLLLLFSLRPLL